MYGAQVFHRYKQLVALADFTSTKREYWSLAIHSVSIAELVV